MRNCELFYIIIFIHSQTLSTYPVSLNENVRSLVASKAVCFTIFWLTFKTNSQNIELAKPLANDNSQKYDVLKRKYDILLKQYKQNYYALNIKESKKMIIQARYKQVFLKSWWVCWSGEVRIRNHEITRDYNCKRSWDTSFAQDVSNYNHKILKFRLAIPKDTPQPSQQNQQLVQQVELLQSELRSMK